MESFYLTDSGKVRDHNEDNVIIVKNKSDEYLMAVADGMGGHRAGEIASAIVINHLSTKFSGMKSVGEKKDAIRWLKEMVQKINTEIFEYTRENPESTGMGTTLVVAIATEKFIIIGNIGDSSGFVFKNKEIHKVTYDHTLVNLLKSTGDLSEREAEDHPKKNVLMKALGANDPIDIDIFDVDTNVSGILLCSDGLTDMLTEEQIERVINSELDIEDKLIRLINKSNNRGGNDNISIAYLERG